MEKLVIAVSQHTVFLAESVLAGCASCSDSARVPFARVLDVIGKHEAGCVDYILPVLANCPKCHVSLDEWSLVSLKKRPE